MDWLGKLLISVSKVAGNTTGTSGRVISIVIPAQLSRICRESPPAPRDMPSQHVHDHMLVEHHTCHNALPDMFATYLMATIYIDSMHAVPAVTCHSSCNMLSSGQHADQAATFPTECNCSTQT